LNVGLAGYGSLVLGAIPGVATQINAGTAIMASPQRFEPIQPVRDGLHSHHSLEVEPVVKAPSAGRGHVETFAFDAAGWGALIAAAGLALVNLWHLAQRVLANLLDRLSAA
jgi:hypothetical protein